MSATLRRPVLDLDDPLDAAPTRTARRAEQAAAPASKPSAAATPPSAQPEPEPSANAPSRPPRRAHKRPAPPERAAAGAAGEPVSAEWRAWSGENRVASFRLPDELLDELEQRAGQLGVPLGMTVATGLLHLFDQDDETVLALVDRAEATRDQARRQARRRTPTLRA